MLTDQEEKSILNKSHDLELIRDIALARRKRMARYEGEVDRAVETFRPNLDRSEKVQIAGKVRDAMRENLISAEEYFLYDFEHASNELRREFVGDIEWAILCARIYSQNPSSEAMFSKYETYFAFQDFFAREVIQVDLDARGGGALNRLLDFMRRNAQAIVKPDRKSRGEGIFIANVVDEASLDEVVKRIKGLGPCVLEGLIKQSDGTAQFHPGSVNTVRCATYMHEAAGQELIFAVLRMGRGSSIVDNGGSGGICAAVDPESGLVVGLGTTEQGERFKEHPDTRVPIVGQTIPRWEDLERTVGQLARVIPGQRYVGWDLALTDGGWVLVEANAGGQIEICQMSLRRGMRDVVERTLGRL